MSPPLVFSSAKVVTQPLPPSSGAEPPLRPFKRSSVTAAPPSPSPSMGTSSSPTSMQSPTTSIGYGVNEPPRNLRSGPQSGKGPPTPPKFRTWLPSYSRISPFTFASVRIAAASFRTTLRSSLRRREFPSRARLLQPRRRREDLGKIENGLSGNLRASFGPNYEGSFCQPLLLATQARGS